MCSLSEYVSVEHGDGGMNLHKRLRCEMYPPLAQNVVPDLGAQTQKKNHEIMTLKVGTKKKSRVFFFGDNTFIAKQN